MAVIKLCPSGLYCPDDFGVAQSSAAFEVLCISKNNINYCRSSLNIEKQKKWSFWTSLSPISPEDFKEIKSLLKKKKS